MHNSERRNPRNWVPGPVPSPFKVPCPTCKATKGKPCKLAPTNHSDYAHRSRAEEALLRKIRS